MFKSGPLLGRMMKRAEQLTMAFRPNMAGPFCGKDGEVDRAIQG